MVDPWTHWSDGKSPEDEWAGDEDSRAVTATGLFRPVRDALVFRVLPGRGSDRVVERFVGMRSCLSALTCRRRQGRAETGRRSWGAGVVDPAVLRISVGSEKTSRWERPAGVMSRSDRTQRMRGLRDAQRPTSPLACICERKSAKK